MAEVKDAILDWVKKWQNPDGVPRTRPGLPINEMSQEELDAKQRDLESAPTLTKEQQLDILKKPLTPRPKG